MFGTFEGISLTLKSVAGTLEGISYTLGGMVGILFGTTLILHGVAGRLNHIFKPSMQRETNGHTMLGATGD